MEMERRAMERERLLQEELSSVRQESALFQACNEDVERKARDRIAGLNDEMHGFYNEWQEVRADRHSGDGHQVYNGRQHPTRMEECLAGHQRLHRGHSSG